MSFKNTFLVFKKKLFLRLKKDLSQAGMAQKPQEFLLICSKYSLFSALFFLVTVFLFVQDILIGLIVSFFVFSGCFLFALYYPTLKKKKKASQVEKDLPLFLMALSVQLNVNMPLEKAIENACRKEKNALTKELSIALTQVKKAGVSLSSALFALSERIDSFILKRALSQIVFVYEHQGKNQANAIRSLAKEQLSVQRAQSKEFSSKLAVYSLLFIAVSVILPSLFQAIVLIGSSFMEISFTPIQIVLIVTVVFPVLDILALFFVKNKTPEFLK